MRKLIKQAALTTILLLATALTSTPAANANPQPPGEVSPAFTGFVSTTTNQITWVHQCALMRCGYHQINPDQRVFAWCYSWNPDFNEFWDLIATRSPWNAQLVIAGYASEDALREHSGQPCDSAGEGGHSPAFETWAHSCAAIGCGYGIIPGNHTHNVAQICQTALSDDAYIWDLVLDHNNDAKDLAGFARAIDVPNHNPNAPLCFL